MAFGKYLLLTVILVAQDIHSSSSSKFRLFEDALFGKVEFDSKRSISTTLMRDEDEPHDFCEPNGSMIALAPEFANRMHNRCECLKPIPAESVQVMSDQHQQVVFFDLHDLTELSLGRVFLYLGVESTNDEAVCHYDEDQDEFICDISGRRSEFPEDALIVRGQDVHMQSCTRHCYKVDITPWMDRMQQVPELLEVVLTTCRERDRTCDVTMLRHAFLVVLARGQLLADTERCEPAFDAFCEIMRGLQN